MKHLQIIENKLLTVKELIAMCRSRKRRIHKKWLKNPRNYRDVPDDKVYLAGEMVFCHPAIARGLRNVMGGLRCP